MNVDAPPDGATEEGAAEEALLDNAVEDAPAGATLPEADRESFASIDDSRALGIEEIIAMWTVVLCAGLQQCKPDPSSHSTQCDPLRQA